ncbi:unnamed protein product [Symbiodinium pilosum]|uniref:Uncharacterized protein n=1 Tax=Symbiodinium pilosum TaxID=2952 RepID=A0A812PSC0_SYMPI|nr:unnamed protein product [Symbiodinium pilosum]
MEVDEGAPFFIAQEDVKDYFYRLGIDKKLGEYFALPAIEPALLREVRGDLPEELTQLMDVSGARIHPCLKVLPMGFSWAFHLAHEAHVEVARRVLSSVPVIRDRRPPPLLHAGGGGHESAMLIYADNCNHLGTCRTVVNRDQVRVREALHSYGLDTHDVVECSEIVESLGVRVNGLSGKVQASPHRDWRLDRALLACQAAPALSGKELESEVIIGHMTADIFAAWDGHALCTDACPSGYAVCESDWSPSESAEVGREDERWRFYRGPPDRPAPRAAALDTSLVFEDPLTVRPEIDGELFGDLCEDPKFPRGQEALDDTGEMACVVGQPCKVEGRHTRVGGPQHLGRSKASLQGHTETW